MDIYSFEKFNLIADIAGGIGQLITGILESNSTPRGILFDRSDTIERAKSNIENSKLNDRCELVAGNMLEKVPMDGDLYIVSTVLNNWDNKHAVTILNNICKAMPDNAKVIIIENISCEDKVSPEEAFRDLLFLTCTEGGCIRSRREFAKLIESSELTLLNVIETSSKFAIIECGKAK